MGNEQPPEYDRISRVKVVLHAELGRCAMTFRDVEQLGPGTVVTLDRLAGEPVELRCRGHCIARGEVVIQDDRFALRVTQVAAQGAVDREGGRRRK